MPYPLPMKSSILQQDIEQPLTQHLKELRNSLAVIIAWFILSVFISYPFSEHAIIRIWENFMPAGVSMAVYSPLEWMVTKLKLSIVVAIAVTLPIFMLQMFRFMSKGLYKNEKKFLLMVVPASFTMFILGACIAYFLTLPMMFKYVILNSTDMALAQISVQKTISTVTTLILGFGIVFQLPLLVIFAVKMNLIKHETLKKQRLSVYAILVAFVMFASPDPTVMSQLLSVVMLVIMFELSLVMMRYL